jgi:hypothetical protein
MKLLDELASQLILGTDRRVPLLPQMEGPLGGLLGATSAAGVTTEQQVLRSAGILAICNDAGFLPPLDERPLPAPCVTENLGQATDSGLVSVLRQILADGPDPLRLEALRELGQAGLHLSPSHLPTALQLGQRYPHLRQALLGVLGQRGEWLAHFDPAWSWAIDGHIETGASANWDTGSQEQRSLHIARLRKTRPAEARELVQNGFSKLDARERAGLLEQLRVGLGSADEDFLESCLADRSKEVRQIAADLLARLPDSRYVGRMAGRLGQCLGHERRLLRQVVTLEAPAQFAPDWKADTLEETRAKSETLGDRAWWLYQLARYVPLEWWPQQTGMNPAELLAWLPKTDWHEAILRAWSEAIRRTENAEWALALYSSKLLKKMAIEPLDLLSHLPLEERTHQWLLVLGAQQSAVTSLGAKLEQIMQAFPQGIPETIANTVLQTLRDSLHTDARRYDYAIRKTLPEFICLIPMHCLDAAAQGWPMGRPETEYFVEPLARILAIIEQRRTLHRTFSLRKTS